jgi:hypothetical protein
MSPEKLQKFGIDIYSAYDNLSLCGIVKGVDIIGGQGLRIHLLSVLIARVRTGAGKSG